jgi:S-adenosylmethionine decarboxylase
VDAYQKGLHILAEFFYDQPNSNLKDISPVQELLASLIKDLGLTELGSVFHSFPGKGYTVVVCLAESHISMHSWPEHGVLTLDVYLSNNEKDNADKARGIYNSIRQFFNPNRVQEQLIWR